jgi:hypothetical protein
VNKTEEWEKRVKEFKRTFETVDGQEVLKYLENKYHINKSSYSKKDDSHETAFNEGQRSVVLDIRNKVLAVLK